MTTGARRRATLTMLDGPTPGRVVALDGDSLLIGRGEDCDLVLRDPLKAVSTHHARVVREPDGSHAIEDLRSLNRTEVDGATLHGTRAPLREGSRVRIIHFHLTYSCRDDDSATIRNTLDATLAGAGESLKVRPEEKLRGVLEICRAVGSSRDRREIGRKALDCLFRIFPQADGGLVLLDTADGIEPIARVRDGEPADARFSRTIYGRVVREGKAILCEDILGEFGLSESIDYTRLFMMMCAPLLDFDRRPIGMIQVDTSRRRGRFTADDLDLLAAVAGPVGIFVENANLQRLGAEVQQAGRDARELQEALLPASVPDQPGYAFWDAYEPALFVGGDLFDYLPVPTPGGRPGRLAIVVADVAGKGMPAAKRMARFSTILRQALLTESRPAAAVARANRELFELGDVERFVTLLLGVIDAEAHTLTVVRAGHPAPLVRRAGGTVEPLAEAANGMVLGLDRDAAFVEATTDLRPGDHVVAFSDGITEAMDASSRWFGEERLRRVIAAAPAGPDRLGGAILGAVRRFVGGHEQSDDITLVCFAREA